MLGRLVIFPILAGKQDEIREFRQKCIVRVYDASTFPSLVLHHSKRSYGLDICNLVKTMNLYIIFGSSKVASFLQSFSSSSSFRLIGREQSFHSTQGVRVTQKSRALIDVYMTVNFVQLFFESNL